MAEKKIAALRDFNSFKSKSSTEEEKDKTNQTTRATFVVRKEILRKFRILAREQDKKLSELLEESMDAIFIKYNKL